MAQAPGEGTDKAWVRSVPRQGGTAWLGREPRVQVALALWPWPSGSRVKPAFLSLQKLCPDQTTGFLRGSHRVTLLGAAPWRKLRQSGQAIQAGGEVRAGRALHHICRGARTRSRGPGARGLGAARKERGGRGQRWAWPGQGSPYLSHLAAPAVGLAALQQLCRKTAVLPVELLGGKRSHLTGCRLGPCQGPRCRRGNRPRSWPCGGQHADPLCTSHL